MWQKKGRRKRKRVATETTETETFFVRREYPTNASVRTDREGLL